MGLRRLAALIGVTALALALPSAAGAKTHRHTSHHHKAPSVAKTASTLVAAVRHAQSPKARHDKLLALLRKLHVAVYTGSGKSLVSHASAARHSFFYDFELAPLVGSLARGDRVSMTDLAAQLTTAGLHPAGGSLSAGNLAAAISAGVKSDLRHPKSAAAMPALVLRDLGQGDTPRTDITKLHAADSLDSLQAHLVTMAFAQLTYDTPSAPGKGKARKKATKHSSHKARAASGSSLCGDLNQAKDAFFTGGMDGLSGKMMKKVIKKLFKQEFLSKAQRAALKLEAEIEDGLHGSALALSVAVHGYPETAGPVHYNHSASEHNVLEMHVLVEMLDDYGDTVVKCGPLAGLKFPAKGGIPNVPMHWDAPNLDKYGQVVCGDDCTKTGPDGIATLRLAVNTERIPGYGLQQEATDNADVIAAYQSAFGAGLTSPSFIAQYATPKIGGVRWFVDYHKEPNLSLRFVDQHDETYSDQPKGQFESTGTGSQHFALSANAPLAEMTTTDGTRLWTGDAPINWDAFSYNDDGGKSLCQDGRTGTIDYDGVTPSPGELIVDSVQQAPGGGPGDLAVVLHAGPEPSYVERQTFHQGASRCADFSNTFSRDYWDDPGTLLGTSPNTNVTTSNPPEHSSYTYRITGFQPGPGSAGGEGVYAYRDFAYNRTDAWGQPYSGHMRIEIVATPSP